MIFDFQETSLVVLPSYFDKNATILKSSRGLYLGHVQNTGPGDLNDRDREVIDCLRKALRVLESGNYVDPMQ